MPTLTPIQQAVLDAVRAKPGYSCQNLRECEAARSLARRGLITWRTRAMIGESPGWHPIEQERTQ